LLHYTAPVYNPAAGEGLDDDITEYNTISTEVWQIDLPGDWSERECSAEHTVYFESADGTKGAYFSTWCFRDDPRSARQILESFRSAELRTLSEMEDSRWESVGEWSSDTSESTVLGEDFLDRRAHYRIACQLIARLPWLVRSTFHDYDCTDYDESKQFFHPIIESMQIHGDG
jgi:hypothetical protein